MKINFVAEVPCFQTRDRFIKLSTDVCGMCSSFLLTIPSFLVEAAQHRMHPRRPK